MKSRIVAVLLLVSGWSARADDWPQWRGPKRDGKSAEVGLPDWPKGGPKLEWTFDKAGLGYSTPAVVGDTMYCLGGDDGKEEFAFAVEVATGKQLWRTRIGPWFKNDWGGGPRGTPAVADGNVYALGGGGDLVCLDAKSGDLRWSKSFKKDLRGKLMSMWGYSESVLLDGDNVICSPGGEDGTLAALDRKTGEVRWRSKELLDSASYSSIVISEACGVRQYVQLTGSGVAGVAARDGKLLWRIDGEGFRVAVIPTAIVDGDHVFTTTDYGAKCMLIKLTKSGDGIAAEKVYANRGLENHHGGVILHDGHVFGSHGNANNKDRLPFVSLNLLTGNAAWRETKALEPSAVVFADGHFFCFGQQTGALARVVASAKGFDEVSRFTIPKESKKRSPQGAIWTHPVIANGKLYLRDQELLYCYALK